MTLLVASDCLAAITLHGIRRCFGGAFAASSLKPAFHLRLDLCQSTTFQHSGEKPSWGLVSEHAPVRMAWGVHIHHLAGSQGRFGFRQDCPYGRGQERLGQKGLLGWQQFPRQPTVSSQPQAPLPPMLEDAK